MTDACASCGKVLDDTAQENLFYERNLACSNKKEYYHLYCLSDYGTYLPVRCSLCMNRSWPCFLILCLQILTAIMAIANVIRYTYRYGILMQIEYYGTTEDFCLTLATLAVVASLFVVSGRLGLCPRIVDSDRKE